MEVLVTMAAQEYGITPWTYVRTRTYRQLFADVQALAKRWSWPAEVLLSAFGGGKGGGTRTGAHTTARDDADVSGQTGALPAWFKRKRGWNYSVHDLGPIKGEESTTYGRDTAAHPNRAHSREDYAISVAALKASFSAMGGALTGAPIKAGR